MILCLNWPFPDPQLPLYRSILLSLALLVPLTVSCGSSSGPVSLQPTQPSQNQQTSQETPDPDSVSLVTFEIPFEPVSFPLIDKTTILSIPIDVIPYDDFIVIWEGSMTPDTVAQSRSGNQAQLPSCAIPHAGSYTLSATAYAPLDADLLVPWTTSNVGFVIDPGCHLLSIEEVNLPTTTNESQPEELEIRVRIEDENGELILDDTNLHTVASSPEIWASL